MFSEVKNERLTMQWLENREDFDRECNWEGGNQSIGIQSGL